MSTFHNGATNSENRHAEKEKRDDDDVDDETVTANIERNK
jgi:hypothetical protein